MTDNKIIQALECDTHIGCEDCPYFRKNCNGIIDDKVTAKDILDLINHQKAEIERLEDLVAEKQNLADQWRDNVEELLIEIQIAKAEAVKEFAEGFENELTKIEEIYFDEEHENFISANKVIALLVNLVKEMVGKG